MSGVAFVAMPWASPDTPSIQIGLVTAAALRAGHDARAFNLHLEAADFFVEQGIALADVEAVSRRWWSVGLGEWIFAPAGATTADEDEYLAYLVAKDVPRPIIDAALGMRSHVADFLDHTAGEILACAPRMVGFTTTFAQTQPSVALAARLKSLSPDVQIVFGGANCDAVLGETLLAEHPCIDLVVQGRAEAVVPLLCDAAASGEAPPALPGVLSRSTGTAPRTEPIPRAPALLPDYDDYFDRLSRSRIRDELAPRVRLVIETARGCWWGERQHCKFCGLNGSSMAFSSNPAGQVLSEIGELARRYRRTEFDVVDNIIDPSFFETVLPALAAERQKGHDYRFFWEVKSNLTPEQVGLLRRAGVHRIQPGIESLSTRILRLMRKGVTALDNVRLLAFAASNDLSVTWNIIYGIPGEREEDYLEMAEMVPALVHLKPPGLVPLQVQRFSPYFDDPAAHGLRLQGPARYYRHLYPHARDRLDGLAYVFDHTYVDGHDPERAVAPLRRALQHWDSVWSPGTRHSLRYERGPGYVRLRDRRPGLPQRDILLDEVESDLYLACRTSATAAMALKRAGVDAAAGLAEPDVAAFFDDLASERLMLRDGNRYLALALPLTPDVDAPKVHTPRWTRLPAHAH